jgi:hypothetical protein
MPAIASPSIRSAELNVEFPSSYDRPYFSAARLARVCGINASVIERAILDGRLPARRDGNAWRIEHADALGFYERLLTNPHPSAAHWRAYRAWKAEQREAAI